MRKAAPGVQQCAAALRSCSSRGLRRSHRLCPVSAAFNAGTVLAISAAEDNLSNNPKQDSERRSQAKKDLRLIVASLKEIGTTWTTAHTSAGVLEALMTQWDASSQPPNQPVTNAFASIQNGAASAIPQGSPTSSISSSSGFPQTFDFASASPGPSRADLAAQLPKLEQPSYEPSSGPTGSTPTSFASLGLAFHSRPSTAGGHHNALDGAGGFGTSLGFMFPSWDLDDVNFGPPPGEQANGNGATTAGLDFMQNLLNMPECGSPVPPLHSGRAADAMILAQPLRKALPPPHPLRPRLQRHDSRPRRLASRLCSAISDLLWVQ